MRMMVVVVSSSYRFNEEVKHIKVVEKDSWIHITEAKKFESLLVRGLLAGRPSVGRGGVTNCALTLCRSWWNITRRIH